MSSIHKENMDSKLIPFWFSEIVTCLWITSLFDDSRTEFLTNGLWALKLKYLKIKSQRYFAYIGSKFDEVGLKGNVSLLRFLDGSENASSNDSVGWLEIEYLGLEVKFPI